MPDLKYTRPQRIWLKDHPDFNEKWVQDRIAEDPSILGLGDLILKDQERLQPKGGRLDLLFQDAEADRRYEVEVQLGRTDESHIIRAVEYWDIERKRYPHYDHCAVLVAEDVTSRFLNVISLFNGCIPLIAIQMNAVRVGDAVSLVFTTVLDELSLNVEEDEPADRADRSYWETNRASPETVAMVDRLFEMIHTFDPGIEPRYQKIYIGLYKDGRPCHFVSFRPRKRHLLLYIGLKQSPENQRLLDEAFLDVMDYNKRYGGRYRIRLTMGELEPNRDLLTRLMNMAFFRENS